MCLFMYLGVPVSVYVCIRASLYMCLRVCLSVGLDEKKLERIFFLSIFFINYFLANFLNRTLLLKRFLAASLDIGIFWSKICLVAKSFSSEKVWMKQFFAGKFFFVEKIFCRKFILLQNHFLGKRLEEKCLYEKFFFRKIFLSKFFVAKTASFLRKQLKYFFCIIIYSITVWMAKLFDR